MLKIVIFILFLFSIYLINDNKKLKEENIKLSSIQCEIPKDINSINKCEDLLSKSNKENERVNEELEVIYLLHQKLIKDCAPLLKK